jgi:hypothetical protein
MKQEPRGLFTFLSAEEIPTRAVLFCAQAAGSSISSDLNAGGASSGAPADACSGGAPPLPAERIAVQAWSNETLCFYA